MNYVDGKLAGKKVFWNSNTMRSREAYINIVRLYFQQKDPAQVMNWIAKMERMEQQYNPQLLWNLVGGFLDLGDHESAYIWMQIQQHFKFPLDSLHVAAVAAHLRRNNRLSELEALGSGDISTHRFPEQSSQPLPKTAMSELMSIQRQRQGCKSVVEWKKIPAHLYFQALREDRDGSYKKLLDWMNADPFLNSSQIMDCLHQERVTGLLQPDQALAVLNYFFIQWLELKQDGKIQMVMRYVRDNEIDPDAAFVANAVAFCYQNKLATTMMEWMLVTERLGLLLDRGVFLLMMESLTQFRDTSLIRRVGKMMRSFGFPDSVRFYNSLLRCAGDSVEMNTILDEMRSEGISPEDQTWVVLMKQAV